MQNLVSLCTVIIAGALLAGFLKADDYQLELSMLQSIEANSEEDFEAGRLLLRKITADGEQREPVTERPYTIVRSQTKYSGLMHKNFTYWHIRPLFASRLLWEPGKSNYSVASFRKNFELCQMYGFDGFATFAWPDEARLEQVFEPLYKTPAEMLLQPGEFGIMLEIGSSESYANISDELFDKIVSNPYSFKINGKSVISSYYMDKWPAEKIGGYVEQYRRRSGGGTLFLPQIGIFGLKDAKGADIRLRTIYKAYKDRGALPATLLARVMEYLRDYARACDGLYMTTPPTGNDHTLDYEFADEVLFPLYKAVLAEPEFKGRKLFAMAASVGYTSYHGAQNRSRDGTKTLRKCFELAAKHRPDLIICPEWDELNEDTGFQPQVSCPMSTQRIVKYYTDSFKGIAPAPNPGDDTELPNLIISQRRQLNLGWTHDVELLNVPDTSQSEPYTVILEVFDDRGAALFRSEEEVFDSAVLKDKTFRFPSENFADSQALCSRLIVKYAGREQVVEEGLPFTVLRSTACWDHTYANTPLRNVLRPARSRVEFANPRYDIEPGVGAVEARVDFAADEKLLAVEMVQDSLEIFAWDSHNEFLQNDPERRLYKLSYQYLNNPSRKRFRLKVELERADSALTFNIARPDRPAEAGPAFTQNVSGGLIRWRGPELSGAIDWWPQNADRLISIRKDEAERAIIRVTGSAVDNTDEIIDWSLPFKELGEYNVASEVFEDGLILALETFHRPTISPLPVDTREAGFTRELIVDNPNGVLALRVVSEGGKVYWSKPYAFNRAPSPEKVDVTVYSNSAREFVGAAVASNRVPFIRYDFGPAFGNILRTAAGREFYAHAGGYLSTAIGFVGQEHVGNTTPFALYKSRIFEGADRPAPVWTKDDGGNHVLAFDGERGNFLALPTTFMPQRAGFTFEFEIFPQTDKPEYILFHHGRSYGGLTLGVKNGKFDMAYVRQNPDHPELPSWSRLYMPTEIPVRPFEWQTIIVRRVANQLTLEVNGETASFPCEGIGLYSQLAGFGGRGARLRDGNTPFFKGLLRSLTIRHY